MRALNARLAAADTRPDAAATPAGGQHSRTAAAAPVVGPQPASLRARDANRHSAPISPGARPLSSVPARAAPKRWAHPRCRRRRRRHPEETMRVEKVTLHHYDPLPGRRGQDRTGADRLRAGRRYTMADLQDRSLVRNLLKRGVDLWVVDWGHPSRADQFPVDRQLRRLVLDDCVEHIRGASGSTASRCSASARAAPSPLYAARRGEGEEPDPDDHPDRLPRRPGARRCQPRLHQPLDPQPDRRRHQQADRRLRQPAGEIMASVFQAVAGPDDDKVQPRPPRRRRGRQEAHELCAWRSGLPTARTTRAPPPSSG